MKPAQSEPLVSIGVPVHNGQRYLAEALRSLLAQTHANFELIISDNGSTDRTGMICEEFRAQDPRVRYSRQAATIPAAENFNLVLGQAQGQFFMWAACDDLWEPGFVAQMTHLLQADPLAVIAFCAFDNFGCSPSQILNYPRLFDLAAPGLFARLWRYMKQKERMGKANVIYGLMRTEALKHAGGFRVWGNGPWGADMLVVFRMLTLGRLVLSRELLFHKRVSDPQTASPSQFQPLSVRAGWAEARSKIRDKTGCLKGYVRILSGASGLTVFERIGMRLGVAQLAGYVYWRETMQALISTLARLFSSRPRHIVQNE